MPYCHLASIRQERTREGQARDGASEEPEVIHWETGLSFHIRFDNLSKGGDLPGSGGHPFPWKEDRETGPVSSHSSAPSEGNAHTDGGAAMLLVPARSQGSQDSFYETRSMEERSRDRSAPGQG